MTTGWRLLAALVMVLALAVTTAVADLNDDFIETAKRGDLPGLERLIANGANLEAKGRITSISDYGQTALVVPSPTAIRAAGLKDAVGFTALMWASYRGDKAIVQELLGGADPNTADVSGVTALWMACRNGHQEIATLLLDKGADVNAKTHDGWTALMLASQEGYKDVVELLLARGADVNYGRPLALASQEGHDDIVRLLLANGADVNDGSALVLASQEGHKDVVESLLAKGANANAVMKGFPHRNKSYEASYPCRECEDATALRRAAFNGHTQVVALLIAKGAKVDYRANLTEKTALMLASQEGHEETTELLLANGADVNARINDVTDGVYSIERRIFNPATGRWDAYVPPDHLKTALDFATEHGHTEIAELLKKASSKGHPESRREVPGHRAQ